MSHEKYAHCIDACNDCAIACNYCIAGCLEEDNVTVVANCIALTIDCGALCQLAATAMARGSEHANAVCALCADICNTCSQACAKHESKHCQACAEACCKCAKECERSATSEAAGVHQH